MQGDTDRDTTRKKPLNFVRSIKGLLVLVANQGFKPGPADYDSAAVYYKTWRATGEPIRTFVCEA